MIQSMDQIDLDHVMSLTHRNKMASQNDNCKSRTVTCMQPYAQR